MKSFKRVMGCFVLSIFTFTSVIAVNAYRGISNEGYEEEYQIETNANDIQEYRVHERHGFDVKLPTNDCVGIVSANEDVFAKMGINVFYGNVFSRSANDSGVFYMPSITRRSEYVPVNITSESFEVLWETVENVFITSDDYIFTMDLCVLDALSEADLLNEWNYRLYNVTREIRERLPYYVAEKIENSPLYELKETGLLDVLDELGLLDNEVVLDALEERSSKKDVNL